MFTSLLSVLLQIFGSVLKKLFALKGCLLIKRVYPGLCHTSEIYRPFPRNPNKDMFPFSFSYAILGMTVGWGRYIVCTKDFGLF